jgi:HEAT repeat protein
LVRAAGLYRQYAAFLFRVMQDADSRVRANLIESLWKVDTRHVKQIMRSARSDQHHRVRSNALLGLYFLGDSSAVPGLMDQARNPCPEHRMAAAWAMGQTGNERFAPMLKTLTEDDVDAVRDRARLALSALNTQQTQRPPVGALAAGASGAPPGAADIPA